jgi:uncharacterized membrane protein
MDWFFIFLGKNSVVSREKKEIKKEKTLEKMLQSDVSWMVKEERFYSIFLGEDFLIFIFQFYNERIMDFSFQEWKFSFLLVFAYNNNSCFL